MNNLRSWDVQAARERQQTAEVELQGLQENDVSDEVEEVQNEIDLLEGRLRAIDTQLGLLRAEQSQIDALKHTRHQFELQAQVRIY